MDMNVGSLRTAEDGLQEVMVNSSFGLGSLPVCYEKNCPQNHLVRTDTDERYMGSISACRYSLEEWSEGQEGQEGLESELGTDQGPLGDTRQPGCLARFG